MAACLTIVSPRVRAEDDWQYWSEYCFQFKLTDTGKTRFVLGPAFRLHDNMSHLNYAETRTGLAFAINDHLDLRLTWLYNNSRKTGDNWDDEQRYEVQPTVRWAWGSVQFADRNRLAYRTAGSVHKWRYRNRIRMAKPVTWWGVPLTPFIQNEFFYDFEAHEYNENRAAVGAAKRLSGTTVLSFYYMYRSTKSGVDWNGVNVFGTFLSVII